MFMVGVNAYLLRVCLSTILVGNSGLSQELNWSVEENGFVLSGFFWGYMFGNFPSGILASRYGSRRVLLVSMILQCIITFLSPFVAINFGVYYFFALRVLLGLAQSPVYPVAHSLFAVWLNFDERARGFSIMDAGSYWGAALTLGCGTQIQNALGSWSKVFYLFGTITGIFSIYVYFRVQSNPSEKMPSDDEEEVLEGIINTPAAAATTTTTLSSLSSSSYYQLDVGTINIKRNVEDKIPWKKLLCRLDVFAAIVGPFSINWSLFMFVTYLPKYLQEEYRFNMSSTHSSAYLLLYPYFLCGIIGITCGFISDWLVVSKRLSITHVRKLFQFIAATAATSSLMLLKHHISNLTTVVVILCFAIAPGGIVASASAATPMDLSQEYAGIIKGLANGIATFGGAFNPVLVGYLLTNGKCPTDEVFKQNQTLAWEIASTESCKDAWGTAFDVGASICVFGCIIFLVFGSGKEIEL